MIIEIEINDNGTPVVLLLPENCYDKGQLKMLKSFKNLKFRLEIETDEEEEEILDEVIV